MLAAHHSHKAAYAKVRHYSFQFCCFISNTIGMATCISSESAPEVLVEVLQPYCVACDLEALPPAVPKPKPDSELSFKTTKKLETFLPWNIEPRSFPMCKSCIPNKFPCKIPFSALSKHGNLEKSPMSCRQPSPLTHRSSTKPPQIP